MDAAAVAIQMKSGGYGSKTMEIRWASRREFGKKVSSKLKPKIPIYISTNPSDIKPQELRELYSSCNHSCNRFPKVDHMGTVLESVDIKKLCIALSHSSVLVSVFCNSQDLIIDDNNEHELKKEDVPSPPLVGLGDFLQRVLRLPVVSPSNGQLIGFGRAISDFGLTASIYDVMVIPSLRGMGIGKMVVKRIIRMLTNRDIYDISAVCSANERLFFKACGFTDDILGSTTMMYTKTVSSYSEGDQMIR